MLACLYEWLQVYPEQYQLLLSELNWGKKIPAGMITYDATRKSGRLLVVDVWESREALDIYMQTVFCRVLTRAGLPRPATKYWSLGNYLSENVLFSSDFIQMLINKSYRNPKEN